MEPQFKKLNRFTTITFLIDLLRRKKLVLINPVFWEDYNDRATIEIFREISRKQSIYALCMTDGNETIHHWNAFANGTSGCCIEFSPRKLFEILDKIPEIKHGKAQYLRLKDLRNHKTEIEELPFVKRDRYRSENEYRVIAVRDSVQEKLFEIDLDIRIIRRITINNKIPKSEFESIKYELQSLCPQLKVYQSTLYNNQIWINHFKKWLKP